VQQDPGQLMTRIIKIAIVSLCFALCGAGAFIASTAREEPRQLEKMNAVPVKNRETARRYWIVAMCP
jgi:hypothetical protein